mmetsp:Transcript_42774/g.115360  ORF Transcript_42774/g.115360 Transcript_42774/m.115360 type:complete len:528 (-) Transcript_42774:81-1664(-)
MQLAALSSIGLDISQGVPTLLSHQPAALGHAPDASAPLADSGVAVVVAPTASSAGKARSGKKERAASTKPKSSDGMQKPAPAASKPVLPAPPASASTARGLPVEEPLPQSADDVFTLMSYNVLLPNSEDGWWIYKYYREQGGHTSWPARQGLLRGQFQEASADIICLQEVSDLSFEGDFGFLSADLGYEGLLHEKKGRMRPATFWKQELWQKVGALHKDRTLVVALKRRGGACDGRIIVVVNCHLTAGWAADRRLRQAQEALDSVAKECKRLGLEASATPVVVCGDFNSQGLTAVREFLVQGSVGPDFREAGDPTERGQGGKEVTSKVRSQAVALFGDAAEEAFGSDAPATILSTNIDHKMLLGDGTPTPALRAAVEKAFRRCSSDGKVMCKEDVHKWLVAVNGQFGRGSEYRYAMAVFEKVGREELSLEDFTGLYASELTEGKFWGVEHDLQALGGFGLAVPDEGPVQLRFDYVYYARSALRLLGVREPLSGQQRGRIFGPPWEILPCTWHPSDHLPVTAAFSLHL